LEVPNMAKRGVLGPFWGPGRWYLGLFGPFGHIWGLGPFWGSSIGPGEGLIWRGPHISGGPQRGHFGVALGWGPCGFGLFWPFLGLFWGPSGLGGLAGYWCVL
jgi:hypothetical protein